jgi:uncharacterized membrane protein
MATPKIRIDSVDILRGLVMVIMALDHARDFFSNVRFDPLDLSKTNAALYFTRWITHFCAPVFVFLAGTGAYLSLSRGRSKRDLSRFLWTRGLWLVLIEVTVVSFGWSFDLGLHFIVLQVIWVIGWSMVVLAVVVHLPTPAVGAFGVAMIAAHNILDKIQPERFGVFAWLWNILHVSSWTPIAQPGGHAFVLVYPLIPWIGVMAAGYAFGTVFLLPSGRRRRTLVILGAALTAAFVVLRWTNAYGDPNPWSVQKNALFTVMSFLNCAKYPPSLLYLLMTLGPAIAFLALLDRPAGPMASKICVYGRVPFFYYVLHIPLIHAMSIIVGLVLYGPAIFRWGPNNPPPANVGLGLPGVYAFWLLSVVILYFPCRWFADVKGRRREVWLSYL